MISLIFILLFALIGLVTTFITSLDNFVDNKPNEKLKLNFKGKLFFIISALTLGLYIFQYLQNEKELREKEIASKEDQDRRDFLIRKQGEESRNAIIFSFAEGLAKYKLRWDSSKKELETIIKNSPKNIYNYNGSNPFFSLSKIEPVLLDSVRNNYYYFNLHLFNSEAPSNNLKAKVYAVSKDKMGNMYFLKELNLFQIGAQMGKDADLYHPLNLTVKVPCDIFYFLVVGSWTDLENNKKFNSNQIFHYSFNFNASGGVTAAHDNEIRSFLRSINKI